MHGNEREFNFRGRKPVTIRCCQYLNNVVEQDHRRVKGRLRPMLGFKTFYNARRVIIGIELAQKIHKRQFAIPIPWQSNPALIWRHVMAEISFFLATLIGRIAGAHSGSYRSDNPICTRTMKAERCGSDQWIVCLFTAIVEMACRRACVQESTTA